MTITITSPIGEAQAEWLFGQPEQVGEPVSSKEHCLPVASRYQAVWREVRVGSAPQYMLLDLSQAEFDDWFNNYLRQGFRIHRIATDVLPACAGFDPAERERIDVVWAYAPGVPEQFSRRLSRDDFDRTIKRMFKHGWGLHTIDAYNLDGKIFYNSVWRMRPNQVAVWGWSFDDFKSKVKEMHGLGWTMIVVDSVVTASAVSYSAAWEKTSKEANYIVGYAPNDFLELYHQLRGAGWNLIALNSAGHAAGWYGIDASLKLANKREKHLPDLSASDFSRKQADMVSQYWHLVDFLHEPSP